MSSNIQTPYRFLPLLLLSAFQTAYADTQQTEQNVELNTVQVKGKRTGNITEKEPSYTINNMNTATGLSLSVKDTPQSVSAITRSQLDDKAINSLDEALRNTTGVNVVREASRIRFQSRGFFVDQIGEDGITRNVAGRQGLSDNVDVAPTTDLAVYDHVEILRGAAGLTVSQTEPGGTVNLIRKRPTANFQHMGELSVDNWGTRRTMLDVSGSLSPEDRVRGRLVGVHEHNESFKDRVNGRKNMLFGTIETDIGENGTLSAGMTYQKAHEKPDFTGIHLPCEKDPNTYGEKCGDRPEVLPRETYLAQDWSHGESEQKNMFVKFKWFFDNQWRMNADFNHTVIDSDSRIATFVTETNSWPGAASKGSFSKHSIHPFRYQKHDKQFGFKFDLTGQYEWLGGKHDFYTAYTFNKENVRSRFSRLWNREPVYYDSWRGGYWRLENKNYPIYGATGLEVPEPDWSLLDGSEKTYYHAASGRDYPLLYDLNNYLNKSTNHGISLSNRFNFGKWHILAGGRYTRYRNHSAKILDIWDGERKMPRSDYENYADLKGSKFIPYAALTYDLTPQHSLYASYTGVFKPQENTDTSHRNLLPPILGNNIELGWKASLLNDRLNTSLSLFRIVQKNRGVAVVDNNFMTSMNPVGRVISKGVDIEVAGELTPDWQLFAGYTYNKSRYSRAEKPLVDDFDWNTFQPIKRPGKAWDDELNFSRHTPEHMFRLYTTYSLPGGKWQVGAGINAQSKTSSLYHIAQGGYVLWNGHVQYRFNKNANISLIGTNLGNKTYFENNAYRTRSRNNFYGQPRTLVLKAAWKF